MRGRLPWKPVGILLALAGLAAAGRLLPLDRWLTAFQQFVQGRGLLGMAIFFAAFVAVAMLLGPCWLLSVGAGLTWGFGVALPLVWLSATSASAASFLTARSVGRRRVENAARGNPTFAGIDRAIGLKGWKIVILLRLSPLVPFNLSNYLYGLTAIRFWPYLAATAIGILPLMMVFVSLGAAGQTAVGAGRSRSPWEWALLVVGVLATIVVTVWVTRLARSELEAPHSKPETRNSKLPKIV